ncbi:hypothetical protein Plhal710r2_c059g0169581 [Plasmopara halstedii]
MVVQQRGGSNNSSDNGGTDSENVPVRRQEGLGGGSITPIIDVRRGVLSRLEGGGHPPATYPSRSTTGSSSQPSSPATDGLSTTSSSFNKSPSRGGAETATSLQPPPYWRRT